jgi:hypothetical protein
VVFRELRFGGGRFESAAGWLDLDVVQELSAYKRLVVELAKEQWRRANPGRTRLARGFEEGIRLGFREIKPGSCIIPLERSWVADPSDSLNPRDEVDAAAAIVEATLSAAENDAPFPDGLPARLVPLFSDWGRCLGEGESIHVGPPGAPSVRFDAAIRRRILGARRGRHEDVVELVGEIRGVELAPGGGGQFQVRARGGSELGGCFDAGMEDTMTRALHQRNELHARIAGRAEFDSDGRLHRITRVDSIVLEEPGAAAYDQSVPPIWESLMMLGESVPETEWGRVPDDLAENHEEYWRRGRVDRT